MPSPAFEPVLTRNAGNPDALTIDGYRKSGGYEGLAKALAMEPDAVIDEVKRSGLRGRGGAGFAAGLKWSFIPKGKGKPKYLVCNADESEPGTFKDRLLMEKDPHQLIEGCAICCWAVQASTTYIYIRGEYTHANAIMEQAIKEAYQAGILGDSVLGSGFKLDMYMHQGAGAYICGEETGMIESLEGKRGQPRSRPPFPAVAGLYASPTLINNVETIATIPKVLELGGAEYAKIGAPPDSTGTRVFCVSGNVVKGGNYELPMGITIRKVIYDLAGGIPEGRELKAVIPGGSSMPILTAGQIDVPLEHDALRALDTFLGAAAVIVLDDRACMVQLGLRVAQFYMHESCGKCTPCREGTRWLVQILEAIEEGHATRSQLELLLDVCDRILGKCLCPLGDAAAMPVASYVNKFRDEFRAHVDQGRCPFGGESSLEGLFAPVDQHTHHPVVEEGVPA